MLELSSTPAVLLPRQAVFLCTHLAGQWGEIQDLKGEYVQTTGVVD